MLIDRRNRLTINSTILERSRITATATPILLTKKSESNTVANQFPNLSRKETTDFETGKIFEWDSFISSIHVSVFTTSFDGNVAESEESLRKNVAINSNIVYMKRFIMRLTGEKLEVMYETRNTQKKQKQKNIYYIDISISCRARIHRSVLRNCFTLLSEFPKREACGHF